MCSGCLTAPDRAERAAVLYRQTHTWWLKVGYRRQHWTTLLALQPASLMFERDVVAQLGRTRIPAVGKPEGAEPLEHERIAAAQPTR